MSRTVVVTKTLKAPVEEVFGTFSNSDRMSALPGVKVEVLRPGVDRRDGVGLVRRVSFPLGFMEEEVVGLDEPHRFDYLVRKFPIPLQHEFGRIEFERDGDRTKVVWTSQFSIPGRLSGPAERAGAVLHGAFTTVLKLVERTIRTDA